MSWYSENKDKIIVFLLTLVFLLVVSFSLYYFLGQSDTKVLITPSPQITLNPNIVSSEKQKPVVIKNQNPIQMSEQIREETKKITSIIISAFEQELITRVNDYRTSKGLKKLLIDKRLIQSAKQHNDLMAEQNTLSHQLPTEFPLAEQGTNNDRYDKVNYNWRFAAENVAAGYRTPKDVMTGWINSPGHNANILSIKSRDIGVAYNSKGNYWTQNFGDGRDQNQPL